MKRSAIVATIVILALFGGATYVLGWSNVLPLKKVEVLGTTKTDYVTNLIETAETHAILGKPLARVSQPAIKRTLSNISWIASVNIHRDWFKGVLSVEVVERLAIAQFVDSNGKTNYMDSTGAVFTTNGDTPSVPTITFRSVSEEAKVAAANLLRNLPDDIRVGMQGMKVATAENISLTTKFRNRVITIEWGSAEDLPLKVKVLRALVALPENSKALLFDVSSPTNPITK